MKNKQLGFSFIETMITLLFAVITLGLVVYFIDREPTTLEKQATKARQELRLLENAVAGYTFDLEKPAPTTEQGLGVIIEEGYLSKILIDPWGKPYQYRNPGIYDSTDYWSQGPDGIDSDDDIVGWDPYGSYIR